MTKDMTKDDRIGWLQLSHAVARDERDRLQLKIDQATLALNFQRRLIAQCEEELTKLGAKP